MQLKRTGETTLKPEEQVFHQCETTIVGNFAKQAFSSDRSRSKRIRIFPVFAKSEKKFVSVFIPAKCVSCADSRMYFILFYLFYFVLCSIPTKAKPERINDPTSDWMQKFLYALHTTLCV